MKCSSSLEMVQVIVLIALMLLGDYSRCLTHYSVQNGDGIKKLKQLISIAFCSKLCYSWMRVKKSPVSFKTLPYITLLIYTFI